VPIPTEFLKARAAALGLAPCGVAPAGPADRFDRFAAWLDRGFHGEMDYLAEKRDKRRHPASILPDVRSVVMVGLEYSSLPHSELRISNWGKVARYAQGPDYHRVLWDRLNELAAWLEAEWPGSRTEPVADTAPLLERDFARRAGLGWVGKNTMLIDPKRGSYFFLGAVLTTLEFEPDEPFAANHCGTCTACLDACPTAAFPEPGVLDATKCVSYLTIELRSPIPEPLRAGVGDWLYGCDVCQEVCPWNRFAGPGVMPHDPTLAVLDCVKLLSMTDEQYRLWFRGTSFFRAKRGGLLRNAAIVLGNTGDESAIPALRNVINDTDEGIADAASWALRQIVNRTTAPDPRKTPA
jgi:epoxyqueuosine reductase